MVVHDNSLYFRDAQLLSKRVLAICALAVFAVCMIGMSLAARLQDNPVKPITHRNAVEIDGRPIPMNYSTTALSKEILFNKNRGV